MVGIKERINKYILIFLFGGFLGWCIEFIYRSIISHRIVNPGFLSGPCLPIYGFGLVILTIVLKQEKLNWYAKVFIFSILASLMELISGLFFEYFFHLRLWDYTTEWGNINGFVCPRFFLYWLFGSTLYYLFFYDTITQKAEIHSHSRSRLAVAYILILLVFVDMTHSFYGAEQVSNTWFIRQKRNLPVLVNYKIFEPDRATNFFNSLVQSIKNYSNYKLPDKIFRK